MKKLVIIIVLLGALFLAACQATPENDIVVNKNSGELEKAILSTDAPTESLNEAADWIEEFFTSDSNVKVVVNAIVETPEVKELPVISCVPRYFALTEINTAIKALYGDAPLYDNSLSDKEYLEELIITAKQDLESLKNTGEYAKREDGSVFPVYDAEEEISFVEDQLKQLEDDYSKVTDESAVITEISMNEPYEGSQVVNVRDNQTPPMQFYAFNDKNVNDAAMEYEITGSNYVVTSILQPSEQLEIGISREDAEKEALRVITSCGISESKVMSAGKTEVAGKPSYVFSIGRLVDGVPCMPITSYLGTQALGVDGQEYREPWKQENIQVVVSENGVIGFLWECPPEILNTVNENVKIKPYDEIKEMAKTQLQRTLSSDEFSMSQNKEKTVNINKVVLNMMRIAEKDSPDKYYYLPVWDFLGNVIGDEKVSDGDTVSTTETSFLTINAIDGSVVDRGLGY